MTRRLLALIALLTASLGTPARASAVTYYLNFNPYSTLTATSICYYAFGMGCEEHNFLTLINGYRQQYGLVPLKPSVALMSSSSWMSGDMAAKNYFNHIDSLGRDPYTRMAQFGYGYSTARGENIAAGNSSAQATFDQWRTECDPDASGRCTYRHNLNMLDPSYRVIGIGRAYGAYSSYGWYWTTDFGGLVDATIAGY